MLKVLSVLGCSGVGGFKYIRKKPTGLALSFVTCTGAPKRLKHCKTGLFCITFKFIQPALHGRLRLTKAFNWAFVDIHCVKSKLLGKDKHCHTSCNS